MAVGIFVSSSVTDYLDGVIARRYSVESEFGAFVDPVADKLLVVSSLILLVFNLPTQWIVIPAIVIILREFLVSAIREWMASRNRRHLVRVGGLGKVKTASQMASLSLLLSVLPLPARNTVYGETFIQGLLKFIDAAQFQSIGFVFGQRQGQIGFVAGLCLLYLSSVLAAISGAQYVVSFWPVFMQYS